MKTIEQAAKEYAETTVLKETDASLSELINYCEIDFKAGVEFAQRWIPVSEEMPPSRKMVLARIDRGEGKTWLILAEFIKTRTVLAEDFFEDYDDDEMDYDEEIDSYYVPETWVECSYFGDSIMFSNPVIEWRPIELL